MNQERRKYVINISHKACFLGIFVFSILLGVIICYSIKFFLKLENHTWLTYTSCILTLVFPMLFARKYYPKTNKDCNREERQSRGFEGYFDIPKWSTKEERIFWISVVVLIGFILVCTFISILISSGKSPSIFITCDEQKEYAIESIKIHTDFVHGLTQGILLIRQSFFIIVTGLLLYYFVKTKNRISKEKLLLFILFTTFTCHFYEGIHSYWQSEHLNRIYLLTRGLDNDIIQQSEIPTVFDYKELPFFEDENKRFLKTAFSAVIFNYSVYLNMNAIIFYYLIFGLVTTLICRIKPPDPSTSSITRPNDMIIAIRKKSSRNLILYFRQKQR